MSAEGMPAVKQQVSAGGNITKGITGSTQAMGQVASQQRLGPCRTHLVAAQVDLSGVRAWKANR
jgi:hypothetical protein